jgi:NhaP-type Na+/H+ or K+/H+ antiporter
MASNPEEGQGSQRAVVPVMMMILRWCWVFTSFHINSSSKRDMKAVGDVVGVNFQ